MKILLSGNRGFIGSQISEWLEKSDYFFIGFDKDETIPDEKFDVILHFGARTLIRRSKEIPYEYFTDNLDLTMQLLEKARKDGSRIIFPTSGSILDPTNPYSLSKKQGAEWVRLYKELYGLKYYILKLYNIYGETSQKGAVYLFASAALKNDIVTIYGDGSHERDYTHVSDLVRFVSMILDSKVEPGEYEVGTGIGTSVIKLLSIIENITKTKIKREYKEYILPEADVLHSSLPCIPHMLELEKGVKLVIDSIKKRGNKDGQLNS